MASTNAPRPHRRFLPGDPRVEEPYRLTPQLAFRVAMLGFLAIGVFAVLFLRLWALQVLSGDRYLAQANDNRVRTIRIEAPRGPILDRNGKLIVENVPGTRVELWPADLPKTWPKERAELRALSSITGVTVPQILGRMHEHRDDPLTPIVVQRGLKQAQVDYLLERSSDFPGVRLQESWLRKYPYQSLGAQVLGYVGAISPAEYKALKKKGYQPTDQIGQAGVESTYDSYLRGRDGKAQLTVDSLGRPKGAAVLETQPTPGEALKLTLDIGLQRAAEQALTYGIKVARANGRGTLRERRRARRARPEGRRGARHGVEPDVQAVDLLRPPRPEEAGAAARSRRSPPPTTTRASTVRSAPPIRPAPRSSR